MGKKKVIEKQEGAQVAPSVDTSFEIEGTKYDFTRKQFNVPGEGLVDVENLLNESPEKFDALCAKLVQIGSGFITVIE